MSTLHVENLKGPTTGSNANKIIVPSGQTLDASGGTITPSSGQIVKVATYNTGYGSGARTISSSASWTTIAINGTSNNAVNCSQASNVITYNKSANSNLLITINFPSYNSPGGNGHGIRCQARVSGGSYSLVDTLTNGPADGWGWHGYGGSHAAMNNFTWSTSETDGTTGINSHSGNVEIYFQMYVWSSGDTVYLIDYGSSYPKYGTVQIVEVKS